MTAVGRIPEDGRREPELVVSQGDVVLTASEVDLLEVTKKVVIRAEEVVTGVGRTPDEGYMRPDELLV